MNGVGGGNGVCVGSGDGFALDFTFFRTRLSKSCFFFHFSLAVKTFGSDSTAKLFGSFTSSTTSFGFLSRPWIFRGSVGGSSSLGFRVNLIGTTPSHKICTSSS